MAFNILSKKSSAGIYIGEKQIVACRIAKNGKGFYLDKILFFEIEPELIDKKGSITNPNRLSAIIKENFSQNNFRPKKAATSASGIFVSFKRISVKIDEDSDIKKLILSEATKHIPFHLNEVYVDYQILNEGNRKSETKEALIVAAKKEIVDSHISLLKKISVKPALIDLDIFALYNAYIFNYGRQKNAALLINVNYKKTFFIVIKNQTPLFMLEIAARYPDQNNRFEDKIGLWRLKIENAIELFYSEYPDQQIDKILLSGECASLASLEDYAKNITTDVSLFDPFKRINIASDPAGDLRIKKALPYAGISIGLAIREFY